MNFTQIEHAAQYATGGIVRTDGKLGVNVLARHVFTLIAMEEGRGAHGDLAAVARFLRRDHSTVRRNLVKFAELVQCGDEIACRAYQKAREVYHGR